MKIREALLDAWNVLVFGKTAQPTSPTADNPPVADIVPPVAIQSETSEVASDDAIPNIPVPVNKVPDVMEAHIGVIAKYIFVQVRKAILKNKPTARLFYINGSNLVAEVKAADFEANLRDLYKQFIKTEEYEYAKECDRIIKKLLVNKVIDESRHRG